MTNDIRKQGQSRRHFLMSVASAAGVGAGPAAETLSGQPAALGALDETVTALVNGRFHTMDTADTVVSTVSIRHNRIIAVGGPVPKAGRGVRVIDLKGRTVVPGLVEPHIRIIQVSVILGLSHHSRKHELNSARVQEALAARARTVA